MILELTGLGALDRPVAGVVNPRRYLVGEKRITDAEKLERHHADVRESFHDRPAVIHRSRFQLLARVRSWHRGLSEDSLTVDIFGERVEHLIPGTVARTNDGDLAVECDELLENERVCAKLFPRVLE